MGSVQSSQDHPIHQRRPFVFLSHTQEGHDLAHTLFLAIKQRHNHLKYWNVSLIPPAAGTAGTPSFNTHIAEGVDACEFMLGVCDAKCKDSHPRWGCPAEWEMARAKGKLVIIVAVASELDIAKQNNQVRAYAARVQFIMYEPHARTAAAEQVIQRATQFLAASCTPQPIPTEIITICLEGDLSAFTDHVEYNMKSKFVSELEKNMLIEKVRIQQTKLSHKLAASIGTKQSRIRIEIDEAGFAQYTSDEASGSDSDSSAVEDEIEEALRTTIARKYWPSQLVVDDIETVWKGDGSVVVALSMPAPVAHVFLGLTKRREHWLIKEGVRCLKFGDSPCHFDDVLCLDSRCDIAVKAKRLCHLHIPTKVSGGPFSLRRTLRGLCCGRDETHDVISTSQLVRAPTFEPGNLVHGYRDPTPEELLKVPSFEPGEFRKCAGSGT